MTPFAEAGGIKDVVSGLSKALSDDSHEVTVVIPMYKFLLKYQIGNPLCQFDLVFTDKKVKVDVFTHSFGSIRILFISSSCFNDKELVYTYSRQEEQANRELKYGTGHKDSHLMNLVLQRSALEIALQLNEKPDIFHLHDGHCGFLPAIIKSTPKYQKFYANTTCLLTIHNGGIIYQQNITDLNEAQNLTGLSDQVLKECKIEYGYSPIICAGKYGHINTVSEQYANEIISGNDLNTGILGQVFQNNQIHLWGITNGIEKEQYEHPLFQHQLKPRLTDRVMKWKEEYKYTLFQHIKRINDKKYLFGSLIENPDLPLITMQSRITYQKGIDIFYESLKTLKIAYSSVNFLVLGQGEKVYEDQLAELASHSDNLCYICKYDKILSQNLFAAGDFFVIPSRWEPCGLTDFIAQLFGNIPIVHKTGGLVKTIDKINGFSYDENNPKFLINKIEYAIELFQNDSSVLYDLRKNAVNLINEKYTWRKVLAKGYLPLYRKILQ